MILYFQAKLQELNLAYFEFFDVAYFWKYQKSVCLNSDCAQFVLHGVIPKYAVEFLKHIQESEDGNSEVFALRENGADKLSCSEAVPSALGNEKNNP